MEANVVSSIVTQCHTPGCEFVINTVLENLESWNRWAIASKTFACFLGAVSAALGILVSSKKLPDKWHYALSATLAGSIFVFGVLQPYEEYKQFRAAYAKLEFALLTFLPSNKGVNELTLLIKAQADARDALKETWTSPSIGTDPKGK